MTLTDILQSQLTDVFRIGMIVALIATALRTQAAMGLLVPLMAGVVFVAIIIPATMQTGSSVPLTQRIGAGIISNLILLGIGLGVWQAYQRLMRR